MVVLGRHSQVVGRVQRSHAGREELDLGRDIGPHGLVYLPWPRLLSGCACLLNTDLLYSCCTQDVPGRWAGCWAELLPVLVLLQKKPQKY